MRRKRTPADNIRVVLLIELVITYLPCCFIPRLPPPFGGVRSGCQGHVARVKAALSPGGVPPKRRGNNARPTGPPYCDMGARIRRAPAVRRALVVRRGRAAIEGRRPPQDRPPARYPGGQAPATGRFQRSSARFP